MKLNIIYKHFLSYTVNPKKTDCIYLYFKFFYWFLNFLNLYLYVVSFKMRCVMCKDLP
jgi:hypothetical protein